MLVCASRVGHDNGGVCAAVPRPDRQPAGVRDSTNGLAVVAGRYAWARSTRLWCKAGRLGRWNNAAWR